MRIINKRKIIIASAVLIILIGTLAFLNSLKGEFVVDDNNAIEKRATVKNLNRVPNIFATYAKRLLSRHASFYRPLVMMSFALNYEQSRLSVISYHLTNIILHVIVTLLIYRMVLLIFKDPLLAVSTCLLFVAHPVHCETVAYVSGRTDLLVGVFLLLSFILYLRFTQKANKLLFIMILFFYTAAFLSKENSLIFPALIALYHYAFRKKMNAPAFIIICLLTLAFAAMTLWNRGPVASQGGEGAVEHITTTAGTLRQRIPGIFSGLISYFRMLVFPLNLHLDYGQKRFPMFDPQVILGVLTLAALIFLAVRMRRKNRLVTFSIGWFLLNLAPSSNFIPVFSYIADHFLYLPSIGFFLIVSYGIKRLYTRKCCRLTAGLLLLAIVALCFALTVKQNRYWRYQVSFYERTLSYSPNSIVCLVNLGNIYSETGKEKEAITLFKRAFSLGFHGRRVYNGLGVAYDKLGNHPQAAAYYRKAIELDPNYTPSYNNLAAFNYRTGNKEEALELFKKILAIEPSSVQSYNSIGTIYKDMKRYDEAEANFKKAIELAPDYTVAYNSLANLYYQTERTQDAVKVYEEAVRLNPEYFQGYSSLGNIYYQSELFDKAIASYKKALARNPLYADAHYNLAIVLEKTGKKEEAIIEYRMALKSDANFIKAYNNLASLYYKSGKTREAIDILKTAIEKNPKNPQAYANLCFLYFQLDDYPEAVSYYEKAEKLGFRSRAFEEKIKPYRLKNRDGY